MGDDLSHDGARYYGKYRGRVENNLDPEGRARLQVSVPSVFGEVNMLWAMPCAVVASPMAGVYMVPPKDALVWIDFEEGDPERPIWSGCFWNQKQIPAQTAQQAVIKLGATTLNIMAGDGPGGLTITVGEGENAPTLSVSEEGVAMRVGQGKIDLKADELSLAVGEDALTIRSGAIEISGGGGASVKLNGPKVALNGNALEVQ